MTVSTLHKRKLALREYKLFFQGLKTFKGEGSTNSATLLTFKPVDLNVYLHILYTEKKNSIFCP